ncbi:esterase [bacterium CPR1]|nr:esterase [bacterium CPR1]
MRVKKLFPHSRILGQTMPVSIYGHFGVPLLFFPTASADFEELERHGMIDALSGPIQAGHVKVFSIDSINRQSWFNYEVSVKERLTRQAAYDAYIASELVEIIYEDCHGKLPVATAGASLGAFHASNTLFRHPDAFRWGIFMSGIYDMSQYFENYFDDNCYWQNPTTYLPNASRDHRAALRKCSINVICGQGPWERVHWSKRIHDVLEQIDVPHNYDLWGHDVAHDWEWWYIQMNHYIHRLWARAGKA